MSVFSLYLGVFGSALFWTWSNCLWVWSNLVQIDFSLDLFVKKIIYPWIWVCFSRCHFGWVPKPWNHQKLLPHSASTFIGIWQLPIITTVLVSSHRIIKYFSQGYPDSHIVEGWVLPIHPYWLILSYDLYSMLTFSANVIVCTLCSEAKCYSLEVNLLDICVELLTFLQESRAGILSQTWS